MEILRIVLIGSVGSGKTSFIRSVSEIEVVDTDKKATDEIANLKSTTTVALDFGRVTLDNGQVLHLYGTPGQMRFDFMQDILISKAHAFILLINAQRPEAFNETKKILDYIKQETRIPYLIALTHTDLTKTSLEDIKIAIQQIDNSNSDVLAVNATEKASTLQALTKLIQKILQLSKNSHILI